jgi:tetratricopeptide (TPR) repeat protein
MKVSMAENKHSTSGVNLEDLRFLYEEGKNPLAYIPYANGLRRAGALPLALEVCKAGLYSDSYSVTGRTLLARILYDIGRYDAALGELGNVLQIAPDAYGANFLMARILAKKREYNDAMEIIENLKKINAQDEEFKRLESFVHEQIYAMETSADFLETAKFVKPVSIDERVNELLNHLRNCPGVIRFNFSKLPEGKENAGKDLDPIRFLFTSVNNILKDNKMGALSHFMVQVEEGALLMYYLEGSLLNIVVNSEVNVGKLRLQVENLLKS